MEKKKKKPRAHYPYPNTDSPPKPTKLIKKLLRKTLKAKEKQECIIPLHNVQGRIIPAYLIRPGMKQTI